jgi:hypothetical protein
MLMQQTHQSNFNEKKDRNQCLYSFTDQPIYSLHSKKKKKLIYSNQHQNQDTPDAKIETLTKK